MHENGEVAWDALDERQWQVASGTQGMAVPMGTAGESPHWIRRNIFR